MIVGFMETVSMLYTTTTCFRDETAPVNLNVKSFSSSRTQLKNSPSRLVWSYRDC